MRNIGIPALLAVAVFLLIAAVLSMVIKSRKSGEPVDGGYEGGGVAGHGGESSGCDASVADGGCGDGGGGE